MSVKKSARGLRQRDGVATSNDKREWSSGADNFSPSRSKSPQDRKRSVSKSEDMDVSKTQKQKDGKKREENHIVDPEERERIKKVQVSELQQRQVGSNNSRTRKCSIY